MPSSFTHAFAGYVIAQEFYLKLNNRRLLLICMFISMFPDIDVLMHFAGVPDNHIFGHRGITHSLSFALVISYLSTSMIARYCNWRYATWQLRLLLFLILLSHPLLDALTDGNCGVAILAPFDSARFSFSRKFLAEAPLLDEFFSYAAVTALLAEFFCFWLPCLIYYAVKAKLGFTKGEIYSSQPSLTL